MPSARAQRAYMRKLIAETAEEEEPSPSTQGYIVGMYSMGRTEAEISKKLRIKESTVTDIVQEALRRWEERPPQQPGRCDPLTKREERLLCLLARRKPRPTYAQLKIDAGVDAGVGISVIKRILKEHGVPGPRAKK